MSGNNRAPEPRQQSGDESAGWTVFALLVGGMTLYGFVGWLVDLWLGHAPLFLVIGLVVGLVLSIVAVIFRYRKDL